jgi:hypothetical protein
LNACNFLPIEIGIWNPDGSQSEKQKTTIGRPSVAPAAAIWWSIVSEISPAGR